MLKFIPAGSVRPLKLSRRALSGRLRTGGDRMAGYESSLERDWLYVLGFDPRVTLIQEQPYTLRYEADGKSRRYTPDVLAVFKEEQREYTVVYEVKPLDDLRAQWNEMRTRFKAAVRDCRAKGWRFQIVTENHIRTPVLWNAKFLRRYETTAVQPMHRETLLFTLKGLGETTPQALLAATWWDEENRLLALPELWKLIGERKIATALCDRLTMSSPIWLP